LAEDHHIGGCKGELIYCKIQGDKYKRVWVKIKDLSLIFRRV